MPLRTETYEFAAEIERLEAERNELAEQVAQMDPGNPKRSEKVDRGNEIDGYLDGLEWAQIAHEDDNVPVWDADVDAVTLGGLTGGEYGALERDLVEAQAESGQSAIGAQRAFQVREGTIDAPYLDPEASDVDQLAAVASLPVGFLKWAQDRVDDLSSVGNADRTSFEQLVAAKSSDQPPEQS